MEDKSVHKVCRTCLSTQHKLLKTIRKEELFIYNRILLKDCIEKEMYLCIYCRSIFRKINNFIKQCEIAEELLNGVNKTDTTKMKLSYNLTTSPLEINFYVENELTVKEEMYEDDIPLILLSNHDSDCGDMDSDLKTDGLDINTDIKEEVDNGQDGLLDEKFDLASNQTSKRDKFDKKLYKNKKNKKKDTVPNGFSSRMVRETDEYTVIKLTKEQVLVEMEANRKSEKYSLAPYKCEKCVKGFNFEDVLQGHMEKHSPKNGALKCELCTQYCPSAISLRGHLKSHTTKYKCKICNIVRHSRQHILEHYSLEHTDTTPDYKCKECEFTTKKRTVMQRHVKMHATNEKYTCHKCGRSFKSREILRVHTSRHDDKNRYHCDHCNRTFIYKSVLHKHIRSVHIDKDYYCVECDAMFTSMEALKQHLYKTKKHSDPSQYKYECPQCDEKFLTKSTLGTHQTTVHNAPKSSHCIYCSRAYSSSESLRLHVRRTHSSTDKVSVKCPVCGKVFSRKGVLKVHMRVHTGERPYTCDCGISFTQLASLKAHEAAKHRK